jgi:hypothetical protein
VKHDIIIILILLLLLIILILIIVLIILIILILIIIITASNEDGSYVRQTGLSSVWALFACMERLTTCI